MTKWFRFYADAMRNPKVAALSDREFRLWLQVLSVASENEGRVPPIDDLKRMLKARLDHLSTGLERLLRAGLIDRLGNGYEPHNWSKFQYKSDTSTDRVQKHRGKGNVSETPPEADSETEKIEPLAQQPTAALREAPSHLLDKLLEAAGVTGNPPQGLAFLAPILGLIDGGFDLERDILPAIRAKPSPRARSWSYFVPQIREFVDTRQRTASTPRPVEATVDWAARVRAFYEDGTWATAWGPKPGERGCKAPAELIEARAA